VDWLNWMILGIVMGFTQGFSVRMSQKFGEGDMAALRRTIGCAARLTIIITVITAAAAQFLLPLLLTMLRVPADLRPMAEMYIRILFAGIPCLMFYNFTSSVVRAVGDSKTPLAAMITASVTNIILDCVAVFGLGWGIAGAALATIISQSISAIWVLRFLFGKTVAIPLRIRNIRIRRDITKDIFRLGTANFIMQGTNCLVQVACNSTLQIFGGDLYVGIMTVVNSIREIFMLPLSGMVGGAQPVISFNYGAKDYRRVRSGIRFNTFMGAAYNTLAWVLIVLFPRFWFSIFSDDAATIAAGVGALNIYFFGFVFMAFQLAGQTTFQAVGDAKHAITFSLLRKAIIVAPLTFLLPRLGFGVDGVFLAEPISNIIGGLACYITMRRTVYRDITAKLKVEN
jgi:putative MATE family efflux protein